MFDNEKIAALLHSSNAAFKKGYRLQTYIETIWQKTPESTKNKWRKRAEVFADILTNDVESK